MIEKGQEERRLIKVNEIGMEEAQLAEQLYSSAGLDPVVDAGLKDYDKHLQREDKLISKVFGPRGSDIKGYGEAVAKRVALAVYGLLNKQYGGKVGDLRSYLMALEEERDRANMRYDELMGRVVGILGDEYKELRTDSKEFMERFTTVLGEDLEKSRIDHEALAGKLADIDGLRSQINTLNKEMEQLKERHKSQMTALKNEHDEEVGDLRSQIETLGKEREQLKGKHKSQMTALKNEHDEEVGDLRSQIVNLDSEIKGLESEKTTLTSDLAQFRRDYDQLKITITTLAETISQEEIGERLRDEAYALLLKDSKVPDMVINRVGKFIDFRKYLGLAATKGAEEAIGQADEILRNTLKEQSTSNP